MNESPDFDLDTAVSADLDGELAGYAAELGTDEATLRARITAAADGGERRVQLTAARDAVAAPGEPLDEVARARLVAGALAAKSPAELVRDSRARNWYLRAGVAAAAALVVVGGAVALVARDDGGSGSAAKSAATAGGSVRSGDIGDIGNIDQEKLDRLIGGTAADAAASSTTVAPQSSQAATGSEVNGFDARASARARPDQVTQCTQALGAQGTVRFNGSGAYQGEPAVIVGIAAGDRTVVFVVAAGDCSRVLYSVSR